MSYEGIVQFLEGEASGKWANASDSVVGYAAAYSAKGTFNLATVNTTPLVGVIMTAVKQNETVRVLARTGAIVEAVCGAAITAAYPTLVAVKVDGTGRFVTAAKVATGTTTRYYVAGFALTSTTAAGQKFALLLNVHEMEQV